MTTTTQTSRSIIMHLSCVHVVRSKKQQRNPWSILVDLGRRAQRQWKNSATSVELIQSGRR